MKVEINGTELTVHDGATVRTAILRSLVQSGGETGALRHATARDQWGHELDLDAPLREGQRITYTLAEP